MASDSKNSDRRSPGFESGAVSHTAHNATEEPVILLNFQLLPADWSKGSAIPPK